LLTREIEASLSRAAALIGHIVSMQQVPAPMLRRYFDSLVREQMSGPGYRAEFSYIVLADQAGVPLAWAFRRTDWPSGAGAETARILVAQGPLAAGHADIVSVNVTIHTGEVTMSLRVGYRAEVAIGPLVALSLRTALLASFLALAASAAAAALVRGALGPLASASEQLRRQEQSPWPQPGTETRAPAGKARAETEEPLWEPPPDHAVIAAALPPRPSNEELARQDWQNGVLSQGTLLDGHLLAISGEWLLMVWGTREAEMDDPLRAYAWGRAIDASAVVLMVGTDWPQLTCILAAAEDVHNLTSSAGPWATEAFIKRSHQHLRSRPFQGNLWLVEGERE
ncbi:MAG: hypothetical protein N2512_06870, partial [Armatimonadetes bacterium]|nr:hypothetical protein [Armatimonadota bacterium]